MKTFFGIAFCSELQQSATYKKASEICVLNYQRTNENQTWIIIFEVEVSQVFCGAESQTNISIPTLIELAVKVSYRRTILRNRLMNNCEEYRCAKLMLPPFQFFLILFRRVNDSDPTICTHP